MVKVQRQNDFSKFSFNCDVEKRPNDSNRGCFMFFFLIWFFLINFLSKHKPL